MKKELTIQLNSSQRMVPRGERAERILEIGIKAAKRKESVERPRMNLSLVLDRSGSMHGEKLEFVKRAAKHVVDLLEDGDQVSLVVFDDQVDIISPRVVIDARERDWLYRRISGLRTGGSTNLSGGWLAGCLEVASGQLEGTVNRTLLLTDGMANVGVTDLESLSSQAAEIAARGVSTTTLGVGLGFNEHLLEAMSSQGRGHFYFIEAPSAIPGIFAQELGELSALTVKDLEVTLQLPEGWDCWIYGGWNVHRNENVWSFYAGSLVSDQEVSLYTRLKIPSQQELGLQVVKLTLRGKLEDGTPFEIQKDLLLQVERAEIVAEELVNQRLVEDFTKVEIADLATESLKMERAGRRREASTQLRRYINENLHSLSPNMISDFNQMADSMEVGMDEADRKRRHYENYNLKRQRPEA